MRNILVLLMLSTIASAQFGGFGNIGGRLGNVGSQLGNVANNLQEGVSRIATGLKSVPIVSDVKNFAEFAAQTGKTYATAAEQKLREGLFTARQSLVDANNKAFTSGLRTYELAVNAFADLTSEEFVKNLLGNRKSSQGASKASQDRSAVSIPEGSIPDAFDWRTKGGVTPVKFQGDCGSCWSFATTGAIEGHTFRKTGKLPNLSEQNLVDCGTLDYGLNGCDGGFQEYAFAFIKSQGGIAKGESYPYLDKKGSCGYKKNVKAAEIKGFAAITPKDEDTMKKVVATLGPLACSVNGLESLLLYKKGIYADEECNKGEVNHSVLVVGYGSEKGQDYWIVKNSWDKAWGEEGYFRLPRGKNFCGIAMECSYPIV